MLQRVHESIFKEWKGKLNNFLIYKFRPVFAKYPGYSEELLSQQMVAKFVAVKAAIQSIFDATNATRSRAIYKKKVS